MCVNPPEKPKGYNEIKSSEQHLSADHDSVWGSDNGDSSSQSVTEPFSHSQPDNDSSSRVVTVTSAAEKYEWGSMELSDTRVPLPLDQLPKGIAAFIRAASESLQVPPDLPFLSILGVLSAATRGRFLVQPKAHDPSYLESCAIYAAVFLDPGERKSPTLELVARPLLDAENELIQDSRLAVRQSEELHTQLNARVKHCRDKSVKDPNNVDLQAEYDEAQAELFGFVPVITPLLAVGDVTPEQLPVIMSEQGGSVALISDEGGTLKNLAGRYNNGNSNLDVVNQGFSGGQVRVHRVGRDPVLIKHAHLAVVLTVQPDVAREIRANSEMKGRGTLDRFLVAQPDSFMGQRAFNGALIPDPARNYWYSGIKSLVAASSELVNAGQHRTLVLTPDSLALYEKWWISTEARLGESGDLAKFKGWVSKCSGSMPRIAGLFALIENPHAAQVEAEHMRSALSLWEYLLGQFQFVFGSPITGRTAKVLTVVKELPNSTFTVRDICRKKKFSSDEVKADLAHLRAGNYVRQLPKQGTTSDKWERNPALST
jgi:hypothetical protein